MGCGKSASKAQVYAEEVDDKDLVEAMKPEFDKLADDDKGVPIIRLAVLYDAVTGHETPLSEKETAAAIIRLDPNNTGAFLVASFQMSAAV